MYKKNNNKQNLRGLSQQEKLRKLQKITRIPLSNLKTNIVQSDLQQDDIQKPICHIISQTTDSVDLRQMSLNKNNINHQFNDDKDKINQTIKAMTKQLYSLSIEIQKFNKFNDQYIEADISNFSIQIHQTDQDLSKDDQQTLFYHPKVKSLSNFYSLKQPQKTIKQVELKQVSGKEINTKLIPSQKLFTRRNNQLRLAQQFHNEKSQRIDHNDKSQSINFMTNKKKDCTLNESQNNLSKRFSRSKRQSQKKTQIKGKFNRSNKKSNRLMFQQLNEQFDQKQNNQKLKNILFNNNSINHNNLVHQKNIQKYHKRQTLWDNVIRNQNQKLLTFNYKPSTLNKQSTFNHKLSAFNHKTDHQIHVICQQRNRQYNEIMGNYQKHSNRTNLKMLRTANSKQIKVNSYFRTYSEQLHQQYIKAISFIKENFYLQI